MEIIKINMILKWTNLCRLVTWKHEALNKNLKTEDEENMKECKNLIKACGIGKFQLVNGEIFKRD
jgi:hypothetical protein